MRKAFLFAATLLVYWLGGFFVYAEEAVIEVPQINTDIGTQLDLQSIEDEIDELKQDLSNYKVENANTLRQTSNDALGFVKSAENYSSKTIQYFLWILSTVGFIFVLTTFVLGYIGWKTIKGAIVHKSAEVAQDATKEIMGKVETSLKEKLEDLQNKFEKMRNEHNDALLELRKQQSEQKEEIDEVKIYEKLYREKDPAKRVELWKLILKASPNDTDTISNLAGAFVDMGDLNKGVETANKALAINPYHANALYNRACGYARLGLTDLAIKDIKDVLLNDSSGHFLHLSKKDDDLKALRDNNSEFREILGLDPNLGV
ncbi:MAG: hypothetical protein K9L85_02115 [Candidatus Peribacteraceae bacterium]|nr:hypothetical protein [Candidatus Peribacteraceae bacterium]